MRGLQLRWHEQEMFCRAKTNESLLARAATGKANQWVAPDLKAWQ